jgi:bla regulator protein BlaR1
MIGQWTNHLWQSTLFAIVAALVTLNFRKNRAHVRYCLWLIASVKFLVPFALLMDLGNRFWSAIATSQIATKLAPPYVSLAMQQIAQPFTDSPSLVPSAPLTHTADWIPIAILSIWLCGFLCVVFIRLRGWLRIRAAVRASSPIHIHGVGAVRSSPGLLEPGVVGIRRPTLLLPEGILTHLSPPQLEAVIAHELSHVRRHDNLTAAIHMVVEAVFWFHPLVWWIGARLIEERERACDEAVLSMGGEPRDYADAIVSVCKLYVEAPLDCVSGISGADLKKRIVRIMACDVALSMGLGRKLLLAAAGLLAVAVPVVMGWGQVQSAKLMLIHPQDGARHAFEVATIKPTPETSPGMRINFSPADFSATDMNVSDMSSSLMELNLKSNWWTLRAG